MPSEKRKSEFLTTLLISTLLALSQITVSNDSLAEHESDSAVGSGVGSGIAFCYASEAPVKHQNDFKARDSPHDSPCDSPPETATRRAFMHGILYPYFTPLEPLPRVAAALIGDFSCESNPFDDFF